MDEDAGEVGQAATFDVVLRGYHRGQVDEYVQALQERCARESAALREAERRLVDGGGATVAPSTPTPTATQTAAQAPTPAPQPVAVVPEQVGPGARMERLIACAEREADEIRASAQRDAAAVRDAAKRDVDALFTEHADLVDELRRIRDRIDAMPGMRTPVPH